MEPAFFDSGASTSLTYVFGASKVWPVARCYPAQRFRWAAWVSCAREQHTFWPRTECHGPAPSALHVSAHTEDQKGHSLMPRARIAGGGHSGGVWRGADLRAGHRQGCSDVLRRVVRFRRNPVPRLRCSTKWQGAVLEHGVRQGPKLAADVLPYLGAHMPVGTRTPQCRPPLRGPQQVLRVEWTCSCGDGLQSTKDAAGKCRKCNPGSRRGPGDPDCSQCLPGTYQDEEGQARRRLVWGLGQSSSHRKAVRAGRLAHRARS